MKSTETAAAREHAPVAGEVPCGLFRRLLIMIYDSLPAIATVFLAALAVLPWAGQQILLGKNLPYTLYVVAALFVYFGLCWVRAGQTLGMRAWKVELVNEAGNRPDWREAAIRYLAAYLSLAPAGLGYWACLLREDRACWHDRISKTRLRRTRLPAKKVKTATEPSDRAAQDEDNHRRQHD